MIHKIIAIKRIALLDSSQDKEKSLAMGRFGLC